MAASSRSANTRPVVRPVYCTPSSLTVDGSAGEVVVVVVGLGEGVAEELGDTVGSGDGLGEIVSGTPLSDTLDEFPSVKEPPMKDGTEVAAEAEESGADEVRGNIHHRPQFRRTATTTTTADGNRNNAPTSAEVPSPDGAEI